MLFNYSALAKLDLLVVIDVAMTETAEHADYILPAQTQFEKGEAGPRHNKMTSSAWCDPIAKTPYHKYIPVRVRPLPVSGLTRTGSGN